ncbi:MAG TPA: transcription termination factor Rho, partial [Kofleriaceae bacterium]|nr:transcription termination factor Rho [Kofleriaceae bacterium]
MAAPPSSHSPPPHAAHAHASAAPAHGGGAGGALELAALRRMSQDELCATGERLGVGDARELRRQELVLAILEANAARRGEAHAEGVLEILADGFGFLRNPDLAYQPGIDDIYVSPSQIRRFGMRTGDAVRGTVRAPKETERYFALLRVEAIEGAAPEQHAQLVDFEERPARPARRSFELGAAPPSVRLVDLWCPLGFGQRVLVKAAPRLGKTALLGELTRAIAAAHPQATTTLLAIDLRPEDAAELQRALGELVLISTMDDPPARHVQLVEMVVERGRRIAERGGDAVVLVDAVGRLARALNVVTPPLGRSLVGALDVAAIGKLKRILAGARALEGGGSLTVIAGQTIDSGARLDEVLADELTETAAVEIVLDRAATTAAGQPVIDPARSF